MRLASVTSHAHRLGLAQRLRRHRLGVGVRLLLRVWETRAPGARGQQEAPAAKSKACAPQHLALQHLEAVQGLLDGAGAPGEGPPGFDRLVVLIQSWGEAAQRLDRTGGGALEPGSELRRLALADQSDQVRGQVDGLGDLGRLRAELGQLLRLGASALGLTPEAEPRRSARWQGLAYRLRHGRQGLPRAAWPGREALGLTPAPGVGRHTPIPPEVAALLELAKQAHGRLAASMPACQERQFLEH